jgi:hypothetical protein
MVCLKARGHFQNFCPLLESNLQATAISFLSVRENEEIKKTIFPKMLFGMPATIHAK